MKKKITEKNLNIKDWKPAGPEAIAKVRSRNIAMKIEKEKKAAKFTTRLSVADFEALKLAAESEGMGYQTLLGSIIHKYVTGRLIDIEEAKKILKVG
jgi:predicted DNA binding CopG/RHH family protein